MHKDAEKIQPLRAFLVGFEFYTVTSFDNVFGPRRSSERLVDSRIVPKFHV